MLPSVEMIAARVRELRDILDVQIEDIAREIENVFPLRLQKKIFDLPPQKPANRPLWG